MILPIHIGIQWLYLDVYQGEQKENSQVWDPGSKSWVISDYFGILTVHLKNILKPFNHGLKFYFKVVGLIFFISLFTFLWSLLLIVPGIIKSISYSPALFLLKENPDLRIFESITKSRQLMKGKKKNYIITTFSIIEWFLIPPILIILLSFKHFRSYPIFLNTGGLLIIFLPLSFNSHGGISS